MKKLVNTLTIRQQIKIIKILNYVPSEDESNSNKSEMEVVGNEIVDISNGTKSDE